MKHRFPLRLGVDTIHINCLVTLFAFKLNMLFFTGGKPEPTNLGIAAKFRAIITLARTFGEGSLFCCRVFLFFLKKKTRKNRNQK